MKNIACTQTNIAKMNLASHHSFGSQLGGVYNQIWQYFFFFTCSIAAGQNQRNVGYYLSDLTSDDFSEGCSFACACCSCGIML